MNLPLDIIGAHLPMRLRPESPISERDLLRFCEINDILRIEREPNGDILIMTPAGFGTSAINSQIIGFLRDWTEQDGRGVCTGPDGGYTLPDGSMRSPDAAWISRDRLACLTEKQKEGFVPICPDFVIELRSPSDRLPALKRKMRQWILNGAQVGWLLDPKSRTVFVYGPGEEPGTHFDPSSIQGDGPVRGFELVMARVWG